MSQQQAAPSAPQSKKPLDQKPQDTEQSSSDVLDRINKATQIEVLWSCRNGRKGKPCGCMNGVGHTGEDHSLAPGVLPGGGGKTVYYSNSSAHWCSPYRVRVQDGEIVGIA